MSNISEDRKEMPTDLHGPQDFKFTLIMEVTGLVFVHYYYFLARSR